MFKGTFCYVKVTISRTNNTLHTKVLEFCQLYKYEFLTCGRFESNNINTAEHMGTHIDAPVHFGYDDTTWDVNEIPIERLICPSVVVDFKEKAAQVSFVGVSSMNVVGSVDWSCMASYMRKWWPM